MKVLLCEKAEALTAKSDPGYAFQQALKLQEQWREIGPVAKSLRDEIWERFKTAVDEVVKKYRSHNEKIRAREEANYTEKEALCIKLEAIDFDKMKSARDWERTTAEVLAHQAKWRTIGPAPRKVHNKIYERFRAACDLYFSRKNEFFKNVKADMEKNLELKRALVEKAEELKDSTEWKETAKKIADLQVQWKKIGPVSRKYSDAVWKQFIAAFDYFYEQRAKATSAGKSEEYNNLEAKKTVIQNISSIDEALNYDEALSLLRDYIAEWNKIGFVPIREKEKLHKAFRSAVDAQFDRLKVSERDRRLQQFRSNVTELAGAGKNKKLYSERDRLMRVYERMKNELQTYQNNIGFLSVSSKGADGLMKEVDRKMAALKEDMEVIIKKIETIDENLD